VTLRCWNLPWVGQLFVVEPGGRAAAGLVYPILHEFEVMEFAEKGHRREERPDLPVSLLIVLHALRLECEKTMELTAPIAPASSVVVKRVGIRQLCQRQSPLGLE